MDTSQERASKPRARFAKPARKDHDFSETTCNSCGRKRSTKKSQKGYSVKICTNFLCETAKESAEEHGISLPPPTCGECESPLWRTKQADKVETDGRGFACSNDRMKTGVGLPRKPCPNFRPYE